MHTHVQEENSDRIPSSSEMLGVLNGIKSCREIKGDWEICSSVGQEGLYVCLYLAAGAGLIVPSRIFLKLFLHCSSFPSAKHMPYLVSALTTVVWDSS